MALTRAARRWATASALGLGCVLALPTLAAPADAAAPTPREQHAAQCVAALQVHAEALAAKVKSGDADARPLLQSRIEAGTAFVGDTYLHDTQDEARARGFANDAREAQKSLTPAQLAARQARCADEGATLLTQANGLERMLVVRMANKRMQKMLAD